jgi:hypothetical protein
MRVYSRILMLVSMVGMLALVQCGKDDNPTGAANPDGYEVLFELTPTPSAGGTGETVSYAFAIREKYAYHCNDQAVPECITYVFEDVPDDPGDWMSFPASNLTCIPFFAEVEFGGAHYSFTGTVARPLGQGPGPFVTGNYSKSDGTNFEAGTFTFHEQQLTFGDIAFCGE